jgi:hypothetical protein
MVRVSCAIAIRRPATEVFAFVTDPVTSPIWHEDVLDDSGQPGLPTGSTGVQKMLVLGQHTSITYEVILNNGVDTLTARTLRGPLRYATTLKVTPIEDMSCRVSVVTDIAIGAVFRLAEGAVQSIAEGHMMSDLERLKQTMEALVT